MATKEKEPQPIRPQALQLATGHFCSADSWARLLNAFNPQNEDFCSTYERYPGYFNDETKENTDLLYGKDMAPYYHLRTGNWQFVRFFDKKQATERVLINEISALHRVGEHSNISSIMGVFEGPQKRYVAYSMNGEPFSQIFKEVSESKRFIRFDVVNEIARELLDVLSFMHSKGIVHKNISSRSVYSKYGTVFIPICLTHINPTFCEAEHVAEPGAPRPVIELSSGFAPEAIQEILNVNFNEKVGQCICENKFHKEAKQDVYAAGVFLYNLCMMRPMIKMEGCSEHHYLPAATCSKCLHKRLLEQIDNMTYLWNKYEIRSSRLPPMLRQVVQACLEPLAAERKQANEILIRYNLLDNRFRERLAEHCNDRAVNGHNWIETTVVTAFSAEDSQEDLDDAFEDPDKTPKNTSQHKWVRTSPGSPMWHTQYAHSTPEHPRLAALSETWEVMDREDHYGKLTGNDVDAKNYMTCADAYIGVEREDAHLGSPEPAAPKSVARTLTYGKEALGEGTGAVANDEEEDDFDDVFEDQDFDDDVFD